jgi:integrase
VGKLTARKVETIRAPGLYPDGDNLYLRVRTGGARYWSLRITIDGKRRELGLGPFPTLSLADARDKARAWKRHLFDGLDPREIERRDGLTVERAARDFFDAQRAAWSDGHAARWWGMVERHLLPQIGNRHLGEVTPVQLLELFGPMWTAQHETAKRLLQRLGAIYEHAAASGLYTGQNPTTGLRRALPKVQGTTAHFSAMPWQDVPAFFARLTARRSTTAAALAFGILTAARSGEVRGARWAEIDLEAGTWTIPAQRMKARRPHVVPMSDPAIAVLDRMRGLSPDLVFPSPQRVRDGHAADRPLSSVAVDRLLGRMGVQDATAHGFRTSFRTWCGDHGVDREIAELSLAHRIGNAVEQAYARSDLLDRRRGVMARWAQHVAGEAGPRVVELRR